MEKALMCPCILDINEELHGKTVHYFSKLFHLKLATHRLLQYSRQSSTVYIHFQACQSCRRLFADGETKHHCRACGGGVCDACSTNKKPVPERGWGQAPVRVCDSCFGKSSTVETQPQMACDLRYGLLFKWREIERSNFQLSRKKSRFSTTCWSDLVKKKPTVDFQCSF